MNGLVTNALDHATLSCHEPRSASAGFQVSPEDHASASPCLDIKSEKGSHCGINGRNRHKGNYQNDTSVPKVGGNSGIGLRESSFARALTSGPHAFAFKVIPVTCGCETKGMAPNH